MGEILDMIRAREEEIQVSWACSAQNSELLPDSYKNSKASKEAKKQQTLRHFQGIFPQ